MTAVEGHIVVTTLAGRASLTVRAHIDGVCEPLLTMMLDPDEVLDLATQLTQASVPDPPVVRRRIQVRVRPDGLWGVECPECLPIPGLWTQHASAIIWADRHLVTEHASEVAR